MVKRYRRMSVEMKNVYIVGAAQTPPVRVSDKPVDELVMDAVYGALEDAGIAAEEVDGVITDLVYGPRAIPAQQVAANLGNPSMWTGGRSIGGAGIMSAPDLARQALESGLATVIVFYYGMDNGSRNGPYANHNRYQAKPYFERPYGFTGQPVYFAPWATRYLHTFPGAEAALEELALVCSENASRKGGAQRPARLTADEYRTAPVIATPLRLRDCCVISDGAGAIVMTTRDRARDCRTTPVKVLASTLVQPTVSPESVFTQYGDLLSLPGASEASRKAFSSAGLSPKDVSFAQIYDCFTISCLLQFEDLGFCGKGEAPDFIKSKGISFRGGLPINTHGGFLAYSYLLGVDHVVEAVRQFQGAAGKSQLENIEVGLISGLSMPDYGVLLLSKE